MALTPGTRLGPYEVIAPLGAGGMGEVYKAKDTRLDRTVAIKVLPDHLAATPDLKSRFEREARAVSSLNHPHICTLYDVGEQDGVDYLVMEHIEGETLAARLERGPLPTAEVLRYAAEIADALDKAHRQNLVHRDLKPGNVMLTKSGAKLLDFGLARVMAAPAAPGSSGSIPASILLSQTPTMATPLTGAGMIVGTFQYMAPEQLEGLEADARSDIWAFGATVYEMATGLKAFIGHSQASLIASPGGATNRSKGWARRSAFAKMPSRSSHIAAGRPSRSATTPASTAPMAYPRSRQSRYTPTDEARHDGCATSPIAAKSVG